MCIVPTLDAPDGFWVTIEGDSLKVHRTGKRTLRVRLPDKVPDLWSKKCSWGNHSQIHLCVHRGELEVNLLGSNGNVSQTITMDLIEVNSALSRELNNLAQVEFPPEPFV